MPAPADKVQLIKQESSAGGGDPADAGDFIPESPLDPNEDAPEVQGLYIQPPSPSTTRDKLVYLTRDSSGNMLFRDQFETAERTLTELVAGATGITEATHKTLRQLIHFIDGGPAEGFASGAYRETLPAANPFPTSIIWWESAAKSKKIVEKTITYSGAFPSTIEWKVYDTDGSTVLATVTDTITYSGAFETSRTRAIA